MRGLEPDINRDWLRKLWIMRGDRPGASVETFTAYICAKHPHMMPKDCRDPLEQMQCILRGLF